MRRILVSVGALLLVLTVVAGAPVLLISVAGDPLPDWSQLAYPDYGGRFLLETVLPLAGWAAWLFFTVPFLAALPAAIRDTRHGAPRATTPTPALLRVQRVAATAVVTAVLVLMGSTANASPPPPVAETVALVVDATSSVPSAAPAATPAPPPVPAFRERVIVPHDTLWDIAEDELGDGLRYPEIFHASRGIVQPGGRHLTDPNLILPGWTVRIPTTQTPLPVPPQEPPSGTDTRDSAPPTIAGAPEPAPEHTAHAPTPSPTTTVSPSPTANPAVAAADEGDEEPAAPGVTGVAEMFGMVAGISGALAAGALAAVGLLRMRQRRRRRFGERVPMPTGETATLEAGLRTVDGTPGIDDVDRALRYLGLCAARTGTRVPELYAVRLGADGVSLFLATPSTLPPPFQSVSSDELVWMLPLAAVVDVDSDEAVIPYPTLLQIGQDQAGGILLVDLEPRGVLQIVGDPATVPGVLSAMVLELATSRWADQTPIVIVGQPRGLPRLLSPHRIRHMENLEELLVQTRARAADMGRLLDDANLVTLAQARVSRPTESWTPQIIVTSGDTSDATALAELAELAGSAARTGILLITAGPQLLGEHRLEVRSTTEAFLEPDGLELLPQHTDPHTLTLLHDLVTTATGPPQPPDPVEEVPSLPDEPAVVDLLDEDGDQPRPALKFPVEDQPATEGLSAAPYLRLLGPVGLDLMEDPDRPSPPGRGVELVAYLALHSHATTEAFAQAFWPAAPTAAIASMRKLTNHTRNWLGADPDGGLYLPRHEPALGYRLHPSIRSDWDDFRALIGTDPAAAGTDALVEALRLVRGQPFTGVRHRFWAWNALDQEEMIAVIGDVAAELFRRAYGAGDNTRAGYAATIGNVVDPVNEVAWRNRMLAALASGDTDRFEQIVHDLQEFLDGFDDGYEPEPETQELIDDARRDLVAD